MDDSEDITNRNKYLSLLYWLVNYVFLLRQLQHALARTNATCARQVYSKHRPSLRTQLQRVPSELSKLAKRWNFPEIDCVMLRTLINEDVQFALGPK